MNYKSSDLLLEENIEECIEEEEDLLVSGFNDDDLELARASSKSSRKPGLRDVEIRRSIEDHLDKRRRKAAGEYFDLEELAELEGIAD